jgi:transcription antitermination factor NusG
VECDSVKCLLQTDNIPRAVPDDLIRDLGNAEEMGLFDQTISHLRMEEGEEMRVLEGPFAEFVGKFINAPSKNRVELLLSLFGRETIATFDIDQLQKL